MNETQTKIKLPNDVVSPTDIYRLLREIEMLDEFFRQAQIRTGGTPQAPPRYSRLLDSVVTLNEVNLLEEHQRQELVDVFQHIAQTSPVLHMSFSVDPPGAYVQKIVAWLRENLQDDILLRVGLQPNIGAGCVVRTTNHAYDFSLRKFFDSKREYFGQKLHEAVAAQDKTFGDALDPQILSQAPVDKIDVAAAQAPRVKNEASEQSEPQTAATKTEQVKQPNERIEQHQEAGNN